MLPNLTNHKLIALDTETYDPRLTTAGPGFLRGWGSYMIGFSYAAEGGQYGYIPTRHSHGNYEGDWKAWLQELCADPDRILLFANAKYDIEVLWSENINVSAKIIDVQTNDALLNENYRSFSLASIAERRMLPMKGTIIIENALREKGFVVRGKPDWTRLKDLPLEVLRDYAELDATITLAIYRQQVEELKAAGLEKVADLESALIPIFWKMRLQGVDVNLGEAENLNFELQTQHHELLLELTQESGLGVEPWANKSLARWLKHLGFNRLPQTEKGNDSISNEWLEKQGHPLLDKLVAYRKGEKIRRDYVDALVLENQTDGKVHPQWYSTRGGSYHSGGEDFQGTRTGRPSCVDPNLTQIPARHPVYGPAVRGLFRPAPGTQWGKFDYSSQEPRITLHYAYQLGMPGAAEIWRVFQNNPHTDFHQVTADLILSATGIKIERGQAKTINLGLAYGMGRHKLARQLGLTLEAVEAFLEAYHAAMQFMKPLLKHCATKAQRTGYVKTALGRRRRFHEWENADREAKWEAPIEDEFEASLKWKTIQRAGTYKALNAIIQGSAAEQNKMAMCELYYGHGMIPLVTVYDELGYSISSPEQAALVKKVMEGVPLFSVAHIVDVKLAETWSAK